MNIKFYVCFLFFFMNECDDVRVLEVELVVGIDIMNNKRLGKIVWSKVPAMFIDSFR